MSVLLAAIAIAIGVSLGLLGAGGAIVAVPAFVYIGGVSVNLADGYALFVVAVSSFIAVVLQARSRLVDWKTISWFGPSTIVSLILTRRHLNDHVNDQIQMLLFGLLLLAAASAMLRRKPEDQATVVSPKPLLLSAYGLLIGMIGGLLGVGGGFLMTPALVLWAGLDMKRAVASSLVLICVNSSTGVAVDLTRGVHYDWSFVLTFTGLATAGIIVGTILSRRIDSKYLRASFGWLVLAIGLTVLAIELVSLYSSYGTQS
jgi:uncharacterized membrane protein YfcA